MQKMPSNTSRPPVATFSSSQFLQSSGGSENSTYSNFSTFPGLSAEPRTHFTETMSQSQIESSTYYDFPNEGYLPNPSPCFPPNLSYHAPLSTGPPYQQFGIPSSAYASYIQPSEELQAPPPQGLLHNDSRQMTEYHYSSFSQAPCHSFSRPLTSDSGLYVCPLCSKTCKRKNDMIRHMNQHGPPLFWCHVEGCKRQEGENGFRRRDKWLEHLKKRHGIGS